MQTPKARSGPSEVPQRTSPATPRTARQPKTAGSETDSTSSTYSSTKTSIDRSPKVLERRSPRSPVTEKKRPGRVTELESKLAQLEEELKKAKDQLGSSDSCKMRAQQEGDEAKKQLLAMAMKLEDSQRQLMELSAAEESRLQELRKISQERDRAWESELEALQKQHAMDSATLASAMNEIQRLKLQLEKVAESESAHAKQAERAHAELHSLRVEMTETLSLVDNLKSQLQDTKESETRAKAMFHETSLQLETAKTAVAMIQSDGLKAMELFSSATAELEKSRTEVSSLAEIVSKLQNDLVNITSKTEDINELPLSNGESDQLKLELGPLKMEIEQLRSALEAAETRCQEEQMQSTMQMQSAYELAERKKYESNLREAELEAEVKKAKAEVEELKANLMDKETELQSISAENEGLNLEIKRRQLSQSESGLEIELAKAKAVVTDLKANLMDKETELQSISEENEMLKVEMEKREVERGKGNAEVVAEYEVARAAEREALMKLGYVTEEANKSSRRAARVAEQLEAAQAANLEMDAELRRLRVQSDQWRKAAEAAAAIISTGTNNGKLLERTGSLDSEYHPISSKMLNSPYSEDMDDDESPKKKNNMLKKIGVLWKKGQK